MPCQIDHISFGFQILGAGASVGCGAQHSHARTSGEMQLRGKRPTSSAEKACERLSERLWPVPSGSVTFPFIQKAAHAKEKGARAEDGALSSWLARASAGCRLGRAHYLSYFNLGRKVLYYFNAWHTFTDVQFNEHLARNQAARTFTRLNFR
jgi:hypothetical protein